MAKLRLGIGFVLMLLGAVGIVSCLGLIAFMVVAGPPDLSRGKMISESLIVLAVAAWCAGFVVAGRLLRRP